MSHSTTSAVTARLLTMATPLNPNPATRRVAMVMRVWRSASDHVQ